MEPVLDDDYVKEDNHSLTDWAIFIGKPHESYYIKKWIELEETSKYSFNIGAFLFGVLWMIFRKMYVESVILLGFIFIEGTIEEFVLQQLGYTNTTSFSIISTLTISTIVGFLGNKIYLNHTNRKISTIKNKDYEEITYEQILKESGGTSIIAVIIALLLYTLFFVGLFMLIDMDV